MTMMRFRQAGAVGVISDVPHMDLPVNAFNDALNVRFRGNKAESILGWQNIFPIVNNAQYTPLSITKRPLTQKFFFGTEKYIYSLDAGSQTTVLKNITPLWNPGDRGTGANYPSWDTGVNPNQKILDMDISPNDPQHPWNDLNTKWSTTIISDLIVFNSSRYDPIGQVNIDDSNNPFKVIPGWGYPNANDWDITDVENPILLPTAKYHNWRTNRIATYKQFLIGLGMTEAKTDANGDPLQVSDVLPNRIRWSDAAFEGVLPTNWIESSDQGNLGGFNDLIDANSEILDGLQLRDSFIIYTGSETYIMNLGGDQLFTFEKLFPDTGIMSPGCVAEFDGKHFVVGSNDIFIHDGSQKKSVVEGKIKDKLAAELSSVNFKATRVYMNPAKKEIWVCYPYEDAVGNLDNIWYCNRAAIWNWEYGTWTFATLPRIYDMAIGNTLPNIDDTWADFIDQSGTTPPTSPPDDTWDVNTPNMYNRHWTLFVNGLGNQYLYGVSADHCFYILDNGNTEERIVFSDPTNTPKTFTVDEQNHTCSLIRDGIDFDDQEQVGFGMKMVRNIYPQCDGGATLQISFGGNNGRGEAVRWDNSSSYNIPTDYKMDCFSTKRFHSIKISSVNQPQWITTGWDLDYVNAGLR